MDSNDQKTLENGIFLNGKAQAIEILRMLDPEEKQTLLNNMKMRNPEMTMELSEKSLSFKNVQILSDHELAMLCNRVEATIMGVALKESNPQFQRRVLSLMDREYAEQAYSALMARLRNEKSSSFKAQERVTGIAIQLSKRHLINLI